MCMHIHTKLQEKKSNVISEFRKFFALFIRGYAGPSNITSDNNVLFIERSIPKMTGFFIYTFLVILLAILSKAKSSHVTW